MFLHEKDRKKAVAYVGHLKVMFKSYFVSIRIYIMKSRLTLTELACRCHDCFPFSFRNTVQTQLLNYNIKY